MGRKLFGSVNGPPPSNLGSAWISLRVVMVAVAVLLFIALSQEFDELANALVKLVMFGVVANLVFACLPRRWMSAPPAGTTAPPLYPPPYGPPHGQPYGPQHGPSYGPPLEAGFQQQYEASPGDPFAPVNHHLR